MNTKNLIVLAIFAAVASAANAQKGAHMPIMGTFSPAFTKPVTTAPVIGKPAAIAKPVSPKPAKATAAKATAAKATAAKAKAALMIKGAKPVVVEPDLKTTISARPLMIKAK